MSGLEPVPKQVGDRILGHVAEQDGCQRDAELRRRKEPVQIAEGFAHDARFPVAAPRHRFDPCAPGRDKREFRRHEEGVGQDERDDGQQPQTQDVHGLIVLDLRRGYIRAPR